MKGATMTDIDTNVTPLRPVRSKDPTAALRSKRARRKRKTTVTAQARRMP